MKERLEVRLADRHVPRVVGHLLDIGHGAYFEYAPSFLAEGIELSPINLPTQRAAFPPGPPGLHRLRGLFYDALPDGWGLRVLHQRMRDAGVRPFDRSPVSWLRFLGVRGMGALTFHPERVRGASTPLGTVAELERHARQAQASDVDDLESALKRAGGSSGGARAKVVVAYRDDGAVADPFLPLRKGFRHVLIKFAASRDAATAPRLEGAYLDAAAEAGIVVPPHKVLALGRRRWALVVDRFDRVGDERRHVHSFAGLHEIDIQRDYASYDLLVRTTLRLTGDVREARQAWRLAAFNVLTHNRDDHARNVAFLMTPDGTWCLAPAYDLTCAEGAGGYHAMSIGGESRAPGRAHLMALAELALMPGDEAAAEWKAMVRIARAVRP